MITIANVAPSNLKCAAAICLVLVASASSTQDPVAGTEQANDVGLRCENESSVDSRIPRRRWRIGRITRLFAECSEYRFWRWLTNGGVHSGGCRNAGLRALFWLT